MGAIMAEEAMSENWKFQLIGMFLKNVLSRGKNQKRVGVQTRCFFHGNDSGVTEKKVESDF